MTPKQTESSLLNYLSWQPEIKNAKASTFAVGMATKMKKRANIWAKLHCSKSFTEWLSTQK